VIALIMKFSVHSLLMAFVPIFVSIDVLGGVPMYITLTQGLTDKAKHRLIIEATLAAGTIALVFLVSGKLIFSLLGITEDDFRIGGGIVLLVLGVTSLLASEESHRNPGTSVGIVPIGIPLIMGPAALTAIIITADNYGYWLTMVSLVINLAIVWIVFRQSDYILKILGIAGTKAIGKIAWLFLVAIAVMMIRVGVQNIMKGYS
jgi:multiple antibiotic resistance protein